MESARLIEIFSSRQGEGPYVGAATIFLRFQDCALHCRYCDTPDSFLKPKSFRLETPPGTGEFVLLPNPVDGGQLNQYLESFSGEFLSLTGGEPLQHVGFLRRWLPTLERKIPVLLETNGVLPKSLAEVIEWVDVVSMDLKLPSVTGMRAFWQEHRSFLEIARSKQVYVKVVVSTAVLAEELREAVKLVRELAPHVPFILQPVTPVEPLYETISVPHLQEMVEISRKLLSDVRVIPQVHARLGWL